MIARARAALWSRLFPRIDWVVLFSVLSISVLGLLTMRSFSSEQAFFDKQVVWICIALGVFFVASMPSYSFLRRTPVVVGAFILTISLLGLIFTFGSVILGSQNRFDLGFFFVQPSDPAKVVLIVLLAKYFSRRHMEIAHIRHILISGTYAFVVFVLVFLQPDFGGAIIVAAIWLGLVLISGISWKHLAALLLTATVVFAGLWQYGLHPYQKQRVLTFLHPLADIRGAGYNAYQSMVAVGSGQLFGKGIGYGTQSKLEFLPEYQTDFIFAAYAEEWGFVGVCLLLGLFSLLIVRLLMIAASSGDNFDALFAAGIAVYIVAQFTVHAGMNIGLMPVTGVTLPFMSYGGSHLLTEYLALGMVMGMRRHARVSITVRDQTEAIVQQYS